MFFHQFIHSLKDNILWKVYNLKTTGKKYYCFVYCRYIFAKTFKNFKDNLKTCINKRRNLTHSGAAASSFPKCKYFDFMRFLHDRVSNKPSESMLPRTVTRANMDDNQFLLGSSPSPSSCSATSPLPADTVPSLKPMKKTSYVHAQSNSSTPHQRSKRFKPRRWMKTSLHQ